MRVSLIARAINQCRVEKSDLEDQPEGNSV